MSGEYLIAILLVVGVVGFLLMVRAMLQSWEHKPPNFKMPRLEVLDDTRVDRDRRLVLVRRDNVEHLLLIGGSSDVVVEQYAVDREPYQQEAELASIKDKKHSIESGRSASQLKIREISGGGVETGYNKGSTSIQKSNTGSGLKKTTANRSASIVGDLTKSPINPANEERSYRSVSENNSEKQKVTQTTTTNTKGQNESTKKAAQVQKNVTTSSTNTKKIHDSSQVENNDSDLVNTKKNIKKADLGEESNLQFGNNMLEKLQQRQSREPVPSNRVPNFLPRGKDSESVESKTENKTIILTGMNTKSVDFINEQNKTSSEMSQSNQNRDSNLISGNPSESGVGEMSGNFKQGQENTKTHSDGGKIYTEFDEDVFESIGKEMNKILSELRKDSDENAQQNQ